MRLLIQLNSMDCQRLAVAGKGEGIGACAGTEDAYFFSRLYLPCQTEPFTGHPG